MSNYGPNGMVSGLTASAAIASVSSANVHNLNNALPVTNEEGSPTLAMKKNYLLEHLLKENEEGADENKEKKTLSDRQRDRLEDMLRTISTDRSKIGELMMWCVDHADYSQEIVECICESLSILETPIPTKISRLFVVNDILHNCSAKIPNVSNFRKNFQDHLLETMEHLHKALTTCSTKSQAEKFRKQVLSCLAAWQDWSLYPPHYLINLQNIFVGLATSKNIKEEEEIANKESLIAKLEAEKEIDGEPIIDDIDGIPIAKDDIEVDDIDGEAFIDEDIDGVPLAKDGIDGVPLGENEVETSRWSKDDPLSTSRWERNSDNEEGAAEKADEKSSGKWQKVEGVKAEKGSGDDEKTKSNEKREKSPDTDSAKRKKNSTPPPEDEGHRKFLRDVEVKVMRFVDKLEQRGGSKSGLNIQKEAEKFRKQLIEEYEMVRARESRRKAKSERKRGRSKTPNQDSKRQKSSKRREPSVSSSDSEMDIRQRIKSKVAAGAVPTSGSRSPSPRPSPSSRRRSFSGSPRSMSRSPIFRSRGNSRSPKNLSTRRSMSFSPSPKRSVSPSRHSISPGGSPRYTKISRTPSPSSPRKLSSSVKSVKKKKAKKSRR